MLEKANKNKWRIKQKGLAERAPKHWLSWTDFSVPTLYYTYFMSSVNRNLRTKGQRRSPHYSG